MKLFPWRRPDECDMVRRLVDASDLRARGEAGSPTGLRDLQTPCVETVLLEMFKGVQGRYGPGGRFVSLVLRRGLDEVKYPADLSETYDLGESFHHSNIYSLHFTIQSAGL